MKKAAVMAVALVWALHAGAEQKHGVEVYPGAKADADVAKAVAKMGIKDAGTFRTNDAVAKVAEFYRGQKLKQENLDADGALFTGKNVTVTVQRPWMDMKTGTIMKDTLISIVKKK
jgi:hypothetical protein